MKGFHVGEYIEDELEARGWTTSELAVRMTDNEDEQRIAMCSVDFLIALSKSKEPVDCRLNPRTAEQLGNAFFTSTQLWLRLDKAWRIANGFEKLEGM